MSKSPQTVGTIERAMKILMMFTENGRRSLGVTELANELGISKAVVHRVLSSLRESGLVALVEESRRYVLGPAVLTLGQAYLDRQDLRQRARPHLEHLSETTQETATLSLRTGDARVYIDQSAPPREIRMTVELGTPYPLYAGSSSKAFLAFLPAQHVEDYFNAHELVALTDETILDIRALQADLENTRKRGYAKSLGERQKGAASVAAPVFDAAGTPIGVMSICGPLERVRGSLDDLANKLMKETRALSQRLGFV